MGWGRLILSYLILVAEATQSPKADLVKTPEASP